MTKLFIVCGHGAGDPGAGGYGYEEAERVRALAAEMVRLAGNEVILGDTSINWYASSHFNAISNPGIPIIELHMDSASAQAKGAHVIIPGGLAPDSYDEALANWCARFFPGRANTIVNRGDLRNPNICKRRGFNYRLVECGFISNQGDLDKFNANVSTIAADILACFGIAAGSTAVEPIETVDPVDYPPAPMVGENITRLYNPNNGDHLYTDDKNEVEILTTNHGWINEGVAWKSSPAIPVYRLYNNASGQHLFTASYHEASELVKSRAWVFERIAFYASVKDDATEIRRLYNPQSGDHLLTSNSDEIKSLTSVHGWTDEGVAFLAN